MDKKNIKKIEKIIAILKTMPKEKHYILDRPEVFKEIDINGGFEISSDGYISAWDINGGKYWFKPEQLCTLEEAKLKIERNRIAFIKSNIKMKQIQLQNIEKEISQLKKELK